MQNIEFNKKMRTKEKTKPTTAKQQTTKNMTRENTEKLSMERKSTTKFAKQKTNIQKNHKTTILAINSIFDFYL